MGTMIPLRDVSRRPVAFPIATTIIIVLNVICFFLELAGGDAFVQQWSVIPAEVSQGHHLITVLTGMFMHGSWSHIIGNMVFFWAFGPEIEDAMGSLRYTIFYLLGGIVAMAAQVAFDPHSTVPNLGASGAIAAVMGAFLVTYPRDEIKSLLIIFLFARVTFVPAALLIGVWFLMQFLSLGAIAQQPTGGVAYAAHVGGFIFGAVTARLFESRRRLISQ